MQQKRKRIMGAVAAGVATLLFLTACSMMEDRLDDCPTGLYVSFVYDYNVDRADMFRDQVGAVTLYVFDEQGRLVATRDVERPAEGQPIATLYYQDDTRYQLHLALTPGRYRLLALAQQRAYDALLQRPGAKFRRDAAAPQHYTDIALTLDRQAFAPDPTKHRVPHGGVPLDTLWHGTLRQYAIPDTALTAGAPVTGAALVEVQQERPTFAVVSLTRDTNELHVSMHAEDATDDHPLVADDYDVTIVDRNGRIGWDNSVLADDSLLYTPYQQRTVRATGTATAGGIGVPLEQAAHYDFSLSRLMYSDTPRDNAIMRIVHKATGHTVAELNLTHLLAEGRSYPLFQRYSPQEFLDREHRYTLDLVVLGTGAAQRLSYISLSISILNWSKRIQYEVLN